MKSWTTPTPETVRRALSRLKKDVERRYFFSRLENPLWIAPLEAEGCFHTPPATIKLNSGYVQFPMWPELNYLSKMTPHVPEQVVRILKSLPPSDNLNIHHEVMAAVLQLVDPSLSASLLPKVIEFARLPYRIISQDFSKILSRWTKMGPDTKEAAFKLMDELIFFKPDPKTKEKLETAKNDPQNLFTSLEPCPKFDQWEYKDILENGVRVLAKEEPFQTAKTLIKAVEAMVFLKFHRSEIEKEKREDFSEIWCPRVDESSRSFSDSMEELVFTLTYACDLVYSTIPDAILRLDLALRSGRWYIFDRLRQHLYSKYPNEQTRPWIREFILSHRHYGQWDFHFDFQHMVRIGCTHFGGGFLTENERQHIFDAIINGPSKDDFRRNRGEHFTEEAFKKYQKGLHLRQLRPFESVLFDKYQTYYSVQLAPKLPAPRDEDYSPFQSEGVRNVESHSPKTVAELLAFSDSELVDFLTGWQETHRDSQKWWIDINFEGLGLAFQEAILSSPNRFANWKAHWKQIKRPIFLRYAIGAITKLIQKDQMLDLSEWFALCDWILAHPDSAIPEGERSVDSSVQNPNWGSARRAVVDFLEACLNQKTPVPIRWQPDILGLLAKTSLGYDWRLDANDPVFPGGQDPLQEGINNTRSRALERLVSYGFWVRHHKGSSVVVPEISKVLERRFSQGPNVTLPEYGVLGLHIGGFYWLDQEWTQKNTSLIFPHSDQLKWKASFGSYLRYAGAHKSLFGLLKPEFEFALTNISLLKNEKEKIENTVNSLGEHLLMFFIWGLIPLDEANNLLTRFYSVTQSDNWAHLFDFTGRALNNTKPPLDPDISIRIRDFFEWRLSKNHASELQEFSFWLTAPCLDAEWRLKSFSKVLGIPSTEKVRMFLQLEGLETLLKSHPDLVVECFAKLTDITLDQDQLYIQSEKAIPILKYGLNSSNSETQAYAKRARENLLKAGNFQFLEIEGSTL